MADIPRLVMFSEILWESLRFAEILMLNTLQVYSAFRLSVALSTAAGDGNY